MRFRHVAPAGAPIRFSDLSAWVRLSLASGDPAAVLETALRSRLGVSYLRFVSTGRAGLTLILQALHQVGPSDRDLVIVPSYTCFSVAASVVKAGLRPRVVDVDPETLDYDPVRLEAVDTSRVLAIVATNLYGLPNDLPRLHAFARANGLFLVDDAAQTLGGWVGGRPSGTWGDAGLYSFDKGKCVSAIDGGVIVTSNSVVAEAIEDLIRKLPEPSLRAGIEKSIKLAAYVTLLAPTFYWIPNALPQLGLGATVYTTDFPLERLGPRWLALAATMLGRLDEFTAARRENARLLLERLECFHELRPFRTVPEASPAYTRLPLMASGRARRDGLIRDLNQAGIGASASYPASLGDVGQLSDLIVGGDDDLRGGRRVANCILTLPTHPYVSASDRSAIASVLSVALSVRRPATGLSAA